MPTHKTNLAKELHTAMLQQAVVILLNDKTKHQHIIIL
jgi:hypothetical protein